MTAQAKKLPVTPQEYLEFERSAETRHEFFDGVIVAMSGGSSRHDYVVGDTFGSLLSQLRGKLCTPFTGSMRVSVPDCNCYFYPDVSVACEESQFEIISGVESLTNPVVIIEVLSPSTEKSDHEYKLICYQSLPSLSIYVLVAQDRPLVQVYERQPDGMWKYTHYQELEATVELSTIECRLNLEEIYQRVKFDLPPNEAAGMRILEERALYEASSRPT